jgi:hypothetical protein
LKAWRDNTWEKGGPSSIILMVIAAKTFDDNLNITSRPFTTDCQALLAAVRMLPNLLSGEIVNPTNEKEVMFPRGQSEEEQQEILKKSIVFKEKIEQSLCNAQSNEEVVGLLQLIFGSRMPYKVEWVEKFSVAEAIRKLPAQQQKPPQTPKSHRSA